MLTSRIVFTLLILLLAGSAGGQQVSDAQVGPDDLAEIGTLASVCAQPQKFATMSGPNLHATLNAPLGLRATDGTYTGTTSQGGAISLVVLSSQVTQFSISYSCPGPDPGWTSNQTCPIASNSFACSGGGSVGVCTLGVFEYTLAGTVDSATTLSGTFAVLDADNMPTYPCCSLNLTWSASLPSPPSDPTGLTATAYPTVKVNLSWTDNAGDETEYRVERRLDSEVNFTQIATLAPDATSHTDDQVKKGVSYVYRVLACNGIGCSNPSNEATATVPALSIFIGN